MIKIRSVTGDAGQLIDAPLLTAAEVVHRQLRPNLPAAYAATMQAIFNRNKHKTETTNEGRVVGVAVWRVLLKTVAGLELYVDDLVTDELQRSTGVGTALLGWLETEARRQGCHLLSLDSGTQRHRAHRFYFREGMIASAFHFAKPLGPNP